MLVSPSSVASTQPEPERSLINDLKETVRDYCSTTKNFLKHHPIAGLFLLGTVSIVGGVVGLFCGAGYGVYV